MKHLKLLFFALLFSINGFSQIEFMPIGSITSTAYTSLGGEGSGVFNPQKDTLCGGEICRKIMITRKNSKDNKVYSEFIYFQQKGDSIFEYNEYSKKWAFLFKNRYTVGDSFDIKNIIAQFTYTLATVYVDSVVVSNGLNRFACRIKCLPRSSNDTLTFFRFNLYDKFIPDYDWHLYNICTRAYNDSYYYYPLCYTENTLNYHTPLYTGPNCDSITKSTDVLELSDNLDLTLFPNPANASLNIKSSQKQVVRLNVFNMNGQLVLKKTITTPAQLNISPLPDGIYIVKAESDKGISLTRKLIVHH